MSDDPIVPPPLLEIIRKAVMTNENLLYIEQKFGGHLGFYEGGFIYSNPLTWQDRYDIMLLVILFGGHLGFYKGDSSTQTHSPGKTGTKR